ncbi:MAG: hypothetical protein MK102_02225 [Fuerstiella sp.]|nr:hypothetical protein [Fuerstiella sp.]
MTVRFKLCLAVWVATVACSLACCKAQADTFEAGDDWAVEITPRSNGLMHHENTVGSPLAVPANVDITPISDSSDPSVQTRNPSPSEDYRRVYESVPFNRTEFKSNPSYRHDSTMEILTGNARHLTILRPNTAPVVRPRLKPRTYLLPSRYNQRRRGLNHYFRIPYWNWAGLY